MAKILRKTFFFSSKLIKPILFSPKKRYIKTFEKFSKIEFEKARKRLDAEMAYLDKIVLRQNAVTFVLVFGGIICFQYFLQLITFDSYKKDVIPYKDLESYYNKIGYDDNNK